MAVGHQSDLTLVPLRSKPGHAARRGIGYLRPARRLSIACRSGAFRSCASIRFPVGRQLQCGAPRDPDLDLSALWRVLPIRDADGPHDVRRDPAREHAGTLLRLRPRRQVPQRRLRLHVRPNIAVGSCLRAGFACDREGRLSRAPRVACLARPLLRGSRPFAASASASQLCGITADRVSPSPGLARSQRQP
jgi:hypothetical protein